MGLFSFFKALRQEPLQQEVIFAPDYKTAIHYAESFGMDESAARVAVPGNLRGLRDATVYVVHSDNGEIRRDFMTALRIEEAFGNIDVIEVAEHPQGW